MQDMNGGTSCRASLAVAPNHRKRNRNGLHSTTQCDFTKLDHKITGPKNDGNMSHRGFDKAMLAQRVGGGVPFVQETPQPQICTVRTPPVP